MKKVLSLLVGVAFGCLVVACAARPPLTGEQMMRIQQSPHYTGGKFQNPNALSLEFAGSYPKMISEFMFGDEVRFPKTPPPVENLDIQALTAADELRFAWLGHSTVFLNVEGTTVLTDPVFSNRVSPISFAGPGRFHDRLPVSPENLPEVDVVVISHDHYDHLDRSAIEAIHPKVGTFYVPLGVGAYLIKWGVPSCKVVELDWWEEAHDESGLTLACTPSQHFSGRGLFDRNSTLWCSWTILGQDSRVYFSGDTGYSPHFKEIGAKYGPFDLTLMESGAYSEYWPHIHMLPEQSVQAHVDLGGRIMLPIHWGTFNLALHDWDEPIARVMDIAMERDVRVVGTVAGRVVAPDSPEPFVALEAGEQESRMAER